MNKRYLKFCSALIWCALATCACLEKNAFATGNETIQTNADHTPRTNDTNFGNNNAQGPPEPQASQTVLPTQVGRKGIIASALIMGSGFTLSVGAVVGGLFHLMAHVDGGTNFTPYAVIFFSGTSLVAVSGTIANIAMQRRHNAFKRMGFHPSVAPPIISWFVGTMGLATNVIAIALLSRSSGESNPGIANAAITPWCNLFVLLFSQLWTLHLKKAARRQKQSSVDWHFGLGV